MNKYVTIIQIVLAVFSYSFGLANAGEVNFTSNKVYDEDRGVVFIQMSRTGNTDNSTTVYYHERWDYSGTTLSPEEFQFQHSQRPTYVQYNNQGRWGVVHFTAGQTQECA